MRTPTNQASSRTLQWHVYHVCGTAHVCRTQSFECQLQHSHAKQPKQPQCGDRCPASPTCFAANHNKGEFSFCCMVAKAVAACLLWVSLADQLYKVKIRSALFLLSDCLKGKSATHSDKNMKLLAWTSTRIRHEQDDNMQSCSAAPIHLNRQGSHSLSILVLLLYHASASHAWWSRTHNNSQFAFALLSQPQEG